MSQRSLPRYFVSRSGGQSFIGSPGAVFPPDHIIDCFFVGARHLAEREWAVAVDAAGNLQALPFDSGDLSKRIQTELTLNDVSNEIVVKQLLYDILIALKEDLERERIAHPLRSMTIPVPSRFLLEQELQSQGYSIWMPEWMEDFKEGPSRKQPADSSKQTPSTPPDWMKDFK